MTPEEAVAHLTRTEPRFQVGEADIRGVRYRVFTNAPAHLRELLAQSAPAYDGRDALVYRDERWTHGQLCRDVKRLANALSTELCVRPGDKVAMAMRNYPELPILILAVAALGAVAVPLNAWWSAEELDYGLKDCGARVVFADAARLARLQSLGENRERVTVAIRDAKADRHYDELLRAGNDSACSDVPIATDDDFAIIYSSGSTDYPKGVALTHRGAISAVYSWLMMAELAPLVMDPPPPPPPADPAALVITPLFHVTALQAGFMRGLASGSTIVLMYKWNPEEAVRLIEGEGITRFSGVPAQSAELMEAARRMGARLESLQGINGGGAKRPAAQVGPLARAFPHATVGTGWGMTETNALGINLSGPDYIAHPDAAGRPAPPLQEFSIVDGDGQPVATGEIGELTVKSPANMRCYVNRPQETAAAMRDGWLYTGDLACMDEEGLFYFVDRKKSIIVRGGENISCLEVEGALYRHPAVAEAGVFSIPHERLGETVGASIQLRPDTHVERDTLTEFLAGHLARFKIPERIWFRDGPLPRGGTDKIDRWRLRNEYLAAIDLKTQES